ncbi:MAG TPA: alpha/beta fold hydrolase [Thermoanaerobaculia bacterium]|nr:alpha/beta fold hydrolase [Thermoanaerobaculia bacterium]
MASPKRRSPRIAAGIVFTGLAACAFSGTPAPRAVDVKASDGFLLKATYYAAARPGPGVLLLHQSNRTRDSWDVVARQLATAGMNALTLDMRGFGESGEPRVVPTDAAKEKARAMWPGDVDAAFQYLVSQPGVQRDVVGVGGAGSFGVLYSVEAAHRHPAEVKSLVLLSGETLQDGLQFLRQAPQLPGLFAVADDDEYPPTVEAMEWLYLASSSAEKKFVHYSAAQDAPWIWYETADASKVPARGGHGTDMFEPHPDLAGMIVDWLVTTLIRTPGHAPADTLASARTLEEIQTPGGAARVAQRLTEARRRDPRAQLFPEITASIIGQDHMRAKEPKRAVEVLELVLLAYPDSADAHETLAEAYLADGRKDRARQHAERALALLDAHAVPASSWSDTGPRRGEIRRDAQKVLESADR